MLLIAIFSNAYGNSRQCCKKNTPGDPPSGRTTGVLKIGIFYLVAGRKFSITQTLPGFSKPTKEANVISRPSG